MSSFFIDAISLDRSTHIGRQRGLGNRSPYHRRNFLYSSSPIPSSAAVFVHKIGILPDVASRALNNLSSELASEPIYGETALELLEQLKTKHYASIEINDNFSSLLFDQYLDALDGSKLYFLAEDVQKIARYRYTLDNSLSAGNVEPGFEIYNLYHKRVIERLIYSIDRIENAVPQMDFTIDEYLLLDRENEPFAATTAELDEVWRKRIKNSVLSLRLTGDDEEEIVEKLSKRYRNQLSQVLKTNGKDVFQTYLSKVAATVDPHTSYFSPRDSENFNMGLSLSLQGIGAQLTTEDEYTKVVELIKGGPAERADELQQGDRIIGIGQGVDGEKPDRDTQKKLNTYQG